MFLSEVAEIKTGYPLRGKAKPEPNGDLLLVQMKDVDPLNGVNWDSPIKIIGKSRNKPELLEEGDVLFVGRGSRFYATHISKPTAAAVASPHFYVLSLRNSSTYPQYLVWFLNSPAAQKFFASRVEGSALPYISRKTLAELPVILPDRRTQEVIVKTYHCWKKERKLFEELIEKKESLIENILDKSINKGVAA